MVEEEDVAHIPHPFVKPRGNGSGTVSAGVGGGGVPAPVISPVARVHELLECPVCTNSMYPPIHQLGMAPVYMAFLRFMGDEREARSYGYSLEVGSNGRKLIWEGIPRSIRDSHRKVRDSHDGLVIQRNMALFFSGGDRKELKLRVTGRIWKEQQQQQQQQQNLDAGVSSFTPNPCC
ncbi:hypothetical protein BHM03_00014713 [Ensete ventricosum]|nr:hypothetical protein BHM03_00014713 [Ensete ventricosum]